MDVVDKKSIVKHDSSLYLFVVLNILQCFQLVIIKMEVVPTALCFLQSLDCLHVTKEVYSCLLDE